ncbi:family 57 glycosyltransferase [Rhodotorula sp. JG-1b]|nr:family 57 glycosyltransferase [Rhodotorula sp. JG-1b]
MSVSASSVTSRRSKPPAYEPRHAERPASAARRWWDLDTAERDVVLVATFFKVLLFPAYHSTDFEVHRNWLAITHSLPLAKWYYDTTSEWTLDYPPFFAYFERILSGFAYIVDPGIVRLDNLGYDATTALYFQRATVVISEIVLILAAFRRVVSFKPDPSTASILAASIVSHPGLLIVDHIHFQYNGFLLGILLCSILAARNHNLRTSAALFAILLNFKHIYIYLALPYFVFLLRRHCWMPGKSKCQPNPLETDRVIELGTIVVAVCAISFGPFVIAGGFSELGQIFSRLFPFQRGLNHAYWAGNVWAIYTAADRVLVKYLVARGWPVSEEALNSASRGLVGTTMFGVLPNITPKITFGLTLAFTCVYLTKLWFDPTYKRFLDSLVLAAMTSFLWGWHVHEKAALMFLIPLSLTAADDYNHYRSYMIATTAGVFGLFPLLIKPMETPIKLGYTLLWSLCVYPRITKVVYRPLPNLLSLLIDKAETAYLYGFVALQLYTSIGHNLLFPATEAATAFLPLMLTSVYCSAGIIWSWLRLSWGFLTT